jgi:hypothetical protein
MALQTEDPTQLATILLAHEKARARAWKEKNSRALEVLLAPDYLEINSLGRFSKKDILTSLLPTLSLHEFVISDPKLVVASSDADPYQSLHRGSDRQRAADNRDVQHRRSLREAGEQVAPPRLADHAVPVLREEDHHSMGRKPHVETLIPKKSFIL